MKRNLLTLCVILLFISVGCKKPGTAGSGAVATKQKRNITINGPRDYAGKQGKYSVDVMQPQYSDRMIELSKRLQKAQQENPMLFEDLMFNAGPGQPMPYDSGIGLSQSEYDEFLRGTKNIKVGKVGTAPVEIFQGSKDYDNRFEFQFEGPLKELDKIRIDLDSNSARFKSVRMDFQGEVHADNSMFGAWDGLKFTGTEGLDQNCEVIIGVVRETGEHLMRIKGTVADVASFNAKSYDVTIYYGDPN